MRTTTKITNSTNLLYINRNFNSLNTNVSQLANQRQVVELGDDPMSANIGIKLESLVNRSEQYTRNLKSGRHQLGLSDSRLQLAKTQMDEIKTIITGAANSASMTAESRATEAAKLNEIFKTLTNIGNASDGSRYIFGGSKTTNPPFEIVNGRYVNYTGNQDKINIVVDQNTTMPTNVDGSSIYGNMTTTISSGDMNPGINMSTDYSTKLSDLNGGKGVPTGKIVVKYDAYPEGLEVDLSGCDTLEDVKDAIEKQTHDASQKFDPKAHPRFKGMTDAELSDPAVQAEIEAIRNQYVKVTPNTSDNGLALSVCDKETGTPIDLDDIHTLLSVDDHASNKVAAGLGIKGMASTNPATAGVLIGKDLNPVLSDSTLLADLDGYNDGVYTFTNGPKDATIDITETSNDSNNVFNNWQLNGVTIGANTGEKGELYARVVHRGDDILVELYTQPIGKASASDLVAVGTYDGDNSNGGLVTLTEANSSGLSGTVGIVLPESVGEATVNLTVDYPDAFQGSVHVPAFVEEKNPDGTSRDSLNIASGWNIKGLDKPPAGEYNNSHPASTDPDGNVSVNYRYDSESGFFFVELSRPAFDDQPAALVATGKMFVGKGLDDPDAALDKAVSGRIEFEAEEGFENVSGSVYIEIPAGTSFSDPDVTVGSSSSNPVTHAYALNEDAPAGSIALGGAMMVKEPFSVTASETEPFVLYADTTFKKGQYFDYDVTLPNGETLPAGTPLDRDITFRKGTRFEGDIDFIEGTVLQAGQKMTVNGITEGTTIPAGSYYLDDDGRGFPAGGMDLNHPSIKGDAATYGHNLTATFATVEDLKRAVEELGIHVSANVSSNGKSLEFTSRLAGAWLTISEDPDCYEQMGDVYNQLTGLDLNGLVKGKNTDSYGNVFTEVVFYPPNNPEKDELGNIIPVRLVGDDGTITEVEPGYYVRVYSDKSVLNHNFESRDNSSMIAEGFVPAGNWNPDWDPNDPDAFPPFIPETSGVEDKVVLKEVNGSGVNGLVNLDYYGGEERFNVDDEGKLTFDHFNNDNITVFPGGLRPSGGDYITIQQADVYNVTPGVGMDYSGQVHGSVSKKDDGDLEISFYKDTSHANITGKSGSKSEWKPLPEDSDGPVYEVTMYSVNKDGKYLDKNGNITDVLEERIPVGTMVIDTRKLDDADPGTVDNFTLKTGGIRTGGQEREENVFSTINDAIDALNRNDEEALHDLIGNAQRDIDRILGAIAEVGALDEKMEMLTERHEDDIIRYSDLFTKRVGMDDTALAKAVLGFQASMNAYQAAMQVSSSVMQMSLLSYI